jgi:hypothetical protein
MSGIYARAKYDGLFQEELTTQSVRPGYYSIDPDTASNNSKCFSTNGPRADRNYDIGEFDYGSRALRTDIESSLARDWSDTKYTSGNTLAEKRQRLLEKASQLTPKFTNCNTILDLENTRLDIDNKNFRQTAYDVTFRPIIDPREWVFDGSANSTGNNRFGRSSRYDVKTDLIDSMNNLRNVVALKNNVTEMGISKV